MAISFPNHSRSYDESGKRVRFTGYDGMFEIPFSIEIEALERRMHHPGRTEADYLRAFDEARDEIIDTARKTYVRGASTPIVLTAANT